MSKAQQSTIQILNTTYTIRCTETEALYLDRAAEVLNQHLLEKKKQFPQLDEGKLLLLAALQVSHDYVVDSHKHRDQYQQLSQLVAFLEHQKNEVRE